jgi:NAD(P)H-dependent FMN reductase
MSEKNVLILVGSLRADSINRKIAEAAIENAPEGVSLSIYEGLSELPFYNEDIDIEGSVPEAAAHFRAAAGAADAVLIVTPEHNGTMPAALKNALDWASRPFGQGAITNTPLAAIGSAYGQFGGVWAQDDARKSAGIAGAKVLEDLKFSVPLSVVRFAELHPKDDAEVVTGVKAVLAALVSEVEAPAAA